MKPETIDAYIEIQREESGSFCGIEEPHHFSPE